MHYANEMQKNKERQKYKIQDEMLVSIIVLSYSNILQCFELKEPWLVVPLEIGSSQTLGITKGSLPILVPEGR